MNGDGDLPNALNRFVGRERELMELADLVPTTRLLTLTGPGGVGKTRLAQRLAADARSDFRDGLLYIDVAVVESDDLLPSLLAARIGVRHGTGVQALAEALRERHLLLVIDNCSHLVSACAELAMTLLSHCPRLHMLATSTERLRVPGETLWQVPPLEVPEPDAAFDKIASSEAVQLLVERMVEVNPHFVLDQSNAVHLAHICRRLDGLPLALELAAGWVNALSAGEIAEGLDDPLRLLVRGARGAPTRHQSLRAALDWSTAQLGRGERNLLQSVSVFAGTWDLDAARAVCASTQLPAANVLSVLADLVGKSLVQVASRSNGQAVRYRLLDVVRRYALQELDADGDVHALRRRHAEWYRGLAETVPIGEASEDQLDLLLREQDNLRVALNWAIAEADADMGFSLGVRMHAVWYIQGQFGESRTWFTRLLALSAGPLEQRTMIANWASMSALSQGDFAAAGALSAETRAAAEASDDAFMRALSLDGWATILLDQGNLEEAADVLRRERELLRDVPHLDWLVAAVQYRLASIELEHGDAVAAEALCTDALRALDAGGNAWIRARVERVLGRIALSRGDTRTALARFEATLQGARQVGDLQALAYALMDLAHVAQVRRQLPAARQYAREALDVAQRGAEPLVQARALESASAVLASARPEGCLQLTAAALRLRSHLPAAAWPTERTRLARTHEIAHARLGNTAAASAASLGEGITMERALRLAHELLQSVDASSSGSSLPAHAVLTPRELEVAELIDQGLTNRAIAQILFISAGTVRAHVEHILNKLGLRSRLEIGPRLRLPDERSSSD